MERKRARAIFTNDAECDDMNSVVHLLLYANDIELEGLVLSSSIFHYAGDPEQEIEPKRWAGGSWMWEYLDAYEQVQDRLRAHDPRYPTADELREVTCIGNIKTTGDMDEDTDGSELIRKAILKDDPRPIHLLAGGGTNTIARALKHIDDEYRRTDQWDEMYRRVCETAIIYMIVTQDTTYRDYISDAWPDLRTLHCTSIMGIAFLFGKETCPPRVQEIMRAPWIEEHLLNKGPFLAKYHTWADGHVYPGEEDRSQFGSNPGLLGGNWWGHEDRVRHDMISEGDSPSFLYLVDTGLRSLENPSWGGWGGRFMRNPNNEFNSQADYWQSASDDNRDACCGSSYQFSRWIEDWWNEFSVRATWSVEPDDTKVNHAPELSIEGGVSVAASAGENVMLVAQASDPDDDELDYEWFRYHEADTYSSGVTVAAKGPACEVQVPADAKPSDTIHIICRVSDAPAKRDDYLTAYQRIVITIS